MGEHFKLMSLISIIIPVFNREKYICETLNSLARQTYRNWEAVVVDDKSGDSTVELIESMARKDNRIVLYKNESNEKGANVARNIGLEKANGEFVILLDSDDLLIDSALQVRIDYMTKFPDCDFGVFQTEIFSKQPGDLGILWNEFGLDNDLDRFLALDAPWHTSGPIWRINAIRRIGGLKNSLVSYQDWFLHVKALTFDVKYFTVNLRDFWYRHTMGNKQAISGDSHKEAAHLESHEKMFREVFKITETESAVYSRRIAGLFWWLASRWMNSDRIWNFKRAIDAWDNVSLLELVDPEIYKSGKSALFLRRFKGGGRLSWLLTRKWPIEVAKTSSATIHQLNAVESLKRGHVALKTGDGLHRLGG